MLFVNNMRQLFLSIFFVLAVTNIIFVSCAENPDQNIGDNSSYTQDIKAPAHAAKSKTQDVNSPTPLANNETVYITPNGSCYHRKNCPATARSKNVTAVTKAQAIAKGKRACKKCNP